MSHPQQARGSFKNAVCLVSNRTLGEEVAAPKQAQLAAAIVIARSRRRGV